MKNKNVIRTFCNCKLSVKKNIEPHQTFAGSYKNCERSGLAAKYTVSKGQKVSEQWQQLSEQHYVKFIN